MNETQIRKIIRKRNYGFISLMNEYEDVLKDCMYNESEIKTIVEQYGSILQFKAVENFNDPDGRVFRKMNEAPYKLVPLFRKIYSHGAHKVFTTKGIIIPVEKSIPNYSYHVDLIVRDNLERINNLLKFQRLGIKTRLIRAIKQGQTYNEIADKIVKNVIGVSATRAQLIAQTEIPRVHAQAQYDVMKKHGINKYRWITARDKVVCDVCKGYEQHGPFEMSSDSPLPVRDSHPRCRCIVVAYK